MNTRALAIARTGRKLHYTASESRTVCGAQIRYSVADKAYSNNISEINRTLMPMCPKCEAKG